MPLTIWQAVQVGTVVEIGVRFPAILQHPVLFYTTIF